MYSLYYAHLVTYMYMYTCIMMYQTFKLFIFKLYTVSRYRNMKST